ncbi:MAG: hypothetical protein BZY82_09330 [SAR202 cluster bacterium Io17-Chloro-G3]|nr:MAG: hypothetical protein BZY82_09330 [SAR202 cluster bacterium Io17-Chloro-G3]
MVDIPGWILVIPILAFLVFFHELGHFATAKKFGIKVTEFGFGFPPRIWGIQRGETLYSINLIPIGGFVKMVGEEDPTELRSFARQSVTRRAIVLLAGPIMNLVIPIVIFSVILALPHDKLIGTVTIGGVAPGSPAKVAGLLPGDAILSVNGVDVNNHADMVQEVRKYRGKETNLSIRRVSATGMVGFSPDSSYVETITLIPRKDPPKLKVVENVIDPSIEVSVSDARSYDINASVGDTLTQGSVGVLIGTSNAKFVKDRLPIWGAIPASLNRILDVVRFTFSSIRGWLSGGENPGLTGPIGIAQVTGEVAKVGISPILELTALISISLAIVNLLPIPALDGGRLMFVIIEGIRGGKRISSQVEGIIHMTGFGVLIGLILLMSYFDILRILGGGSFFE